MIFCGIDIGTASTKAVALDDEGRAVETAALLAPAGQGEVYWYEHFSQVMDLFAARGLFADEPIACSITGQGGSFVLTDRQYQPVSNVCHWMESADEAIIESLVHEIGQTEFYHATGWPPHGWLAAAKLKQRVERKQIGRDTCHIATVPDFIYAQLTGKLMTDITSAQITGLADFQESQWSQTILDWIGIDEAWLPEITPGLHVLAENVQTRWGPLTLVTGSHDQYAAMEAAGLVKDTSIMLGTGTAWVIDGRTSTPRFDDKRFLTHPGRDLHPDCYGLIVTLWQIGAGLERLLDSFGMAKDSLAGIEAELTAVGLPEGPVRVDLDTVAVEPAGDVTIRVRRYMEWAGSAVAHALEVCGLERGLRKIVATGGAMTSRFWPQAIADICDLVVEAVDCPQFTAYGAALHARQALRGPAQSHRFPETAILRTYTPKHSQEYQMWYHTYQRPILESQYEAAP